MKRKSFNTHTSFGGLYILGAALCIFAFVLIMVQANVRYEVRAENLNLIPKEELIALKESAGERPSDKGNLENNEIVTTIKPDSTTLLILEEGDAMSGKAKLLYLPILDQMKEKYDICDALDLDTEMFGKYDKIVIAVSDYSKLQESIAVLKSWVKAGGNMMIAYPPEYSGCFQTLFEILGIKDSGEATLVDEIRFKDGFMIGGATQDYPILDAYECSLGLSISEDCEIFIESVDEYPVPVLWRRKADEGTVVVDNFGIMEKAYRGIHSAAYSLLGDYCVYPVINGATFYIDDFPSPVPDGDATYITRDYNMSISDFYSQVWWNDMYELGKKHGIRYTGLVIEDYSNQVSGEFDRNAEINRFQYFGNLLLKAGGEIGIHGYNHMPLVLDNFDYKNEYDSYIQWKTTDDMKKAVDEVLSFTADLFPDEELQVYVPPSNVLSEEGRRVLADTSIKTIASVYLPSDMAYAQEFDVSKEDGIINTPRITSGCNIDEYMKLAALSELNFHLVNTHFLHPDDVLDEDRGAELGWKKLFGNLETYMDWLYDSFPYIRNLTGSELAAAVWRYDLTDVNRSYENGKLKITFDNFDRESWMLLRLNENQNIAGIDGGQYREVADNLYLIECDSKDVEISF